MNKRASPTGTEVDNLHVMLSPHIDSLLRPLLHAVRTFLQAPYVYPVQYASKSIYEAQWLHLLEEPSFNQLLCVIVFDFRVCVQSQMINSPPETPWKSLSRTKWIKDVSGCHTGQSCPLTSDLVPLKCLIQKLKRSVRYSRRSYQR